MREDLERRARRLGNEYADDKNRGLRGFEKTVATEAFTAGYLAAQQEAWRPIESAPRDGTKVLVRMPGWYGGGIIETRWVDCDAPGWYGVYGPGPDHWRPLPTPPSHGGDGR